MEGIKAIIGVYRDKGPKGGTTKVQSILFPIKYRHSQVKSWLKKHGFKYGLIDEGKSYWRARQVDPEQFIRIRTISFNPGVEWHENEEEYNKKMVKKLAEGSLGASYFTGKCDAHRHSKEVSRALKMNPQIQSQIVDKIYDKVLAIEAKKGDDSLWPNEDFRHSFSGKSKVAIYGLKDGSLLIKSQNGTKLWKKFDY